jgi:hypothetical protein
MRRLEALDWATMCAYSNDTIFDQSNPEAIASSSEK